MPVESHLFATLFSWTVAVTTITISWPQIWVSCVQRRTSGLSPLATVLGPALNVAWLSYGLLIGDPLQIIVNSLMGLGNLAVLSALLLTRPELFRGPSLPRTLAAPAALLALVGAAVTAVLAGAVTAPVAGQAVGLAAAVFGAVSVIPQPLALLRDRTQDVSGISTGRYLLSATSGGLWLAHGLANGQAAVIGSAFLGLTSAALVLHCVATTRRQQAGQPVAVATRTPALASA